MKIETYTLPAYWASYLINGDASGYSDEEIAVEMLFQHHNNCVKRQTIIEKKGGYLENDTDLFGRDQAYYVDAFGHKSIVRVFPYEDAGMIDDNLFVEKSFAIKNM